MRRELYDRLISLFSRKKPKKYAAVANYVEKRRPAKVLDIGCGYGSLSIYFSLLGIYSTGIDIGLKGLQTAQEFCKLINLKNIDFQEMDACNITVQGYDVAVSTDVYEHLPHTAQTAHLKSVYQALTADGVYLIRAPHAKNTRQQPPKHPDHIGLPTYELMAGQAAQAGFKINFFIAHTPVISPIPYHIFLERILINSSLQPRSMYKGLQKLGLANVVALLSKK